MRVELSHPCTIKEIAHLSGGRIISRENERVSAITTDTREAMIGDLFWALVGSRSDGAEYAENAIKKGCRVLSQRQDTSDIFHPYPNQALLDFASKYIDFLPYILYRIGITGSVGKTTTKEFLKTILSVSFRVHASEGNFNNEIGMPLSILSTSKDSKILVCEMGMNARGEISRMSKCLSPSIGIITNIGSAHIGKLGSKLEIAKAKLEIADGMTDGKILTPYGENLLGSSERFVSFSSNNPSADFYLSSSSGKEIILFYKGDKILRSSFDPIGNQHKECLAAAASAALLCGQSAESVSFGIALISSDNIRQKEIFAKNFHIISDCYNASKESMLCGIREFIHSSPSGKRSLVLGDILELGSYADDIHYEIGKSILPTEIERLFLVGKSVGKIAEGAIDNGFPLKRIFINADFRESAVTACHIIDNCPIGEHIYFKASHAIELWKIIDYIKSKE